MRYSLDEMLDEDFLVEPGDDDPRWFQRLRDSLYHLLTRFPYICDNPNCQHNSDWR